MTAAAKPNYEIGDAEEELQRRRRNVSEALSDTRGKDLADLTEAEFAEGLRRLKSVQARMQMILAEVLVEEVHYGNPNNAFKKPILLKAGAEELRRLLRMTLRRVADDEVVATAEYSSVIVTIGIFDAVGRLLATRRAGCNTKEKRFKKFNGAGWTYDDAREVMHDLLAMAEKRAGSLLTCEVSGATGFFANAEAMAAELEEAEDKPIARWTEDEKQRVYEAAARKKMGRNAIAKLVMDTLGRAQVGSGDDVDLVLAAISQWTPPNREASPPVKSDGVDGEQKPASPAGDSAAAGDAREPTDEEIRAEEKRMLDREGAK